MIREQRRRGRHRRSRRRSSPSPGWPSTPPARSAPASSSRACAPPATSRSSSRWRTPTTPSPASAPCTCPAAPALGSSAAASSARSPSTVATVGHWCRRPSAAALRERFHADERSEPIRMRTMTTTTDDYDDYDDIDDEYPDPGARTATSATPRRCCAESIDIIATAPTMPLSSSPRIDRDEIIELLEESLHRLPDEMRQARWMIKERQEFVAKTRREADELLEAARVQAERMVQRTEVVRAAEQRARQIIETAEADSRRLRHETEDFLDQRLGQLRDPPRQAAEDGRTPVASGCRSASIAARRPAASRRTTRPRASSTRTADAAVPDVQPLLVNAAELLRRPGSRAPPSTCGRPLAELGVVDPALDRRRRRRRRSRLDIADRRHRRRRARSPCPWRGRVPALPGAARRRRSSSTSTSCYQRRPSPIPTPSRSSATRSTSPPMVREEVLLDARRRAAVPATTAPGCARPAASTATSAPCDCDARPTVDPSAGRRSSQLDGDMTARRSSR